MTEAVYYNERNVRITDTRAVFGSKMYVLHNISSVELLTVQPKKLLPIMLAVMLACMTLCAGMIMAGSSASLWGFPLLILPSALSVVLLSFAYSMKPTFIASLSASSGKQQALMSQDEQFIRDVVDALNEAVVNSRK